MVENNIAKEFLTDQHVIYPSHGVGKIIDIETQEIAGTALELYVIFFAHEKMTLRVPVSRSKTSGIRKLSSLDLLKDSFTILRGNAKVKRTMWSRRAQEYETKIHSGNILLIAEVVRDLYKDAKLTEQSYSERELYEAALELMAREVSVAHDISEKEAVVNIEIELTKGLKSKAAKELTADTGATEA
jgi:CarD family transcriptional regulator